MVQINNAIFYALVILDADGGTRWLSKKISKKKI